MERFKYLQKIDGKSDIKLAKIILRDLKSRPYSSNVNFCLLCLSGLIQLAKNDDTGYKLITYNLVSALYQQLKQWPKNGLIIKSVCDIIKHLKGNLFCFLEIGFVKELLLLISAKPSRFISNEKFCIAICSALYTLSTSPPTAVFISHNDDPFFDVLLLDILSDHLLNDKVTLSCLSLTLVLCRYPEVQRRLKKSGIGSAVLKIMKVHPKTENIQEVGCGIILVLKQNYTILRLNADDIILKALEKHKTNKKLAEYACGCLKEFALLEKNAILLLSKRTIQIVLNTMILNLHEVKIQEYCNLVFWSLSIWQKGKDQLRSSRAALAIVESIRFNKNNVKVVRSGCGVLSNLVSLEFAKTLNELKTETVILDAMKRHRTDEVAINNGFHTLRNLLKFNAEKMDTKFLYELQKTAKGIEKQFKSNGKLQRNIKDILSSIENPGAAVEAI